MLEAATHPTRRAGTVDTGEIRRNMDNTFVCAMCGGEFEKEWSDDDAEAELKENFGSNTQKEDCVIVCDECYKKVFPPIKH